MLVSRRIKSKKSSVSVLLTQLKDHLQEFVKTLKISSAFKLHRRGMFFHLLYTGFPIVCVWRGVGAPPHPTIFSKPPPHQN